MSTSTAAATSITAFTSTGGQKGSSDINISLREGWRYQIKGGGGSFSIQKFILNFIVTLNRVFFEQEIDSKE